MGPAYLNIDRDRESAEQIESFLILARRAVGQLTRGVGSPAENPSTALDSTESSDIAADAVHLNHIGNGTTIAVHNIRKFCDLLLRAVGSHSPIGIVTEAKNLTAAQEKAIGKVLPFQA